MCDKSNYPRNNGQHPTDDERLFFDTHGYLILEQFLSQELVDSLSSCLKRTIQRRKRDGLKGLYRTDDPHPSGATEIKGQNVRIYYILNDDPLFQDLMSYEPLMPYINQLLSPQAHFHASDAIWEVEDLGQKPTWHQDGPWTSRGGYPDLQVTIPIIQLKVGYILNDMSQPGQGNLTIVPGSHKSNIQVQPHQLSNYDSFPNSIQVCGPPGTCVMFHNAIWHTGGRPWTLGNGQRIMLYYAYEQPWMMASPEPVCYTPSFYRGLSDQQKQMFHSFVFELCG